MVSKRSDFYSSHVGRAQLALMKRCFPGGYPEVVGRLRTACQLPPLTERALKDTLVHERRAAQLYGAATVWDSESVRKVSDKKLKRKADRSARQTKDGQLLSMANELSCAALESVGAKVGEGAEAGPTGGDGGAPGNERPPEEGGGANGLSVYDRSGSNSTRNLNESMVVPPSAKKAARQRSCKACIKFGVSVERLRAVRHHRSSATQCELVQKAWVDAGGEVSPSDAPLSTTATAATTPAKTPAAALSSASSGKKRRAVEAGSGSDRKRTKAAPARTPSGAPTCTSIGGRGERAAADTAAPAAPTVGRSSGRQRRKTWRALEAAEESAESDSSAESAP